MKNTVLFDSITQLEALQHFAPVIGKLMNNPGLTALPPERYFAKKADLT